MLPELAQDPDDRVRAAHHQIGNSLQSVASMLRLHGRTAPPEAAGALFEASRRVSVITRLHQRLQARDAPEVCLADLLGDVCRDVAELDAVDRDAEVRVDIQPVSVSPGVASAMAIITAELLGNALEHGLRDRSGVVTVTFQVSDGRAHLQVIDDGPGAPGGAFQEGFGLSLVMKMAARIGASMERHSSAAGTRFDIRVSVPARRLSSGDAVMRTLEGLR